MDVVQNCCSDMETKEKYLVWKTVGNSATSGERFTDLCFFIMLRENPLEAGLSRQFLNVGETKGVQSPRVHPRFKVNVACMK